MSVPMSGGAGRYRYAATVQRRTGERDDSGGLLDNWIAFASVRLGLEPLRGREFNSAGRVSAETTHLIYMRYLTGLTPDMRILFGTRIFDIQAIIDIDERHRDFEITAIERFGQ